MLLKYTRQCGNIIALTLYSDNIYIPHGLPHSARPRGPVPSSAVGGYQSSPNDVWLMNTISGTFTLECHVVHIADQACEVLIQLA